MLYCPSFAVLAKNLISSYQLRIFFAILVASLLISHIFLIAPINQDFFSFAYIGEGVAHGGDMYRDFADNKGPVLYLFFAVLAKIFGDHTLAALVYGGAVLDAISIFCFVRIIQKKFSFQLPQKRLAAFGLIAVFVIWYKNFTFAGITGGLYSEQVALPLFAGAILLLFNKKYLLSGCAYALCVLTNLLMAYFGIFFLVLLSTAPDPKKYMRFAVGFCAPIIFFTLSTLINHSFGDFLYNMVTWNLLYGSASQSGKFLHSLALLHSIPSLLITVLLIIGTCAAFFLEPFHKKNCAVIIALIVSSVLSLLGGGVPLFHHYIKIIPLAFFSFALWHQLTVTKKHFTPLFILLGIAVSLNYFLYVRSGLLKKDPPIPDAIVHASQEKKYIQVVPFYSRYYFLLDKRSPDKFFQTYFLSRHYNQSADNDIALHASLDEGKVANTLFLFISKNSFDDQLIIEYIKNFGEKFHLIKRGAFIENDTLITMYSSNTQ